MSAYPSSPVWSYPVTRTLEFQTGIAVGQNGAEQRWMLHAGQESWTLTYPRLKLSERDSLLAFFDTCKGSFDQTWDFVFAGTTYTGCYFDADKFSAVESAPGMWAATVTIRQVLRAPDAGTLASDFPALSSGARAQFPFTHDHGFDTVSVKTEGGRFAWYQRATSLGMWSVGGPALLDSEAQVIWDFFKLARGRYASFAFTDPDSGTRVTNCRFAADRIEWRYNDARQNSIQAQVQQTL